jgi:hypothetical protein
MHRKNCSRKYSELGHWYGYRKEGDYLSQILWKIDLDYGILAICAIVSERVMVYARNVSVIASAILWVSIVIDTISLAVYAPLRQIASITRWITRCTVYAYIVIIKAISTTAGRWYDAVAIASDASARCRCTTNASVAAVYEAIRSVCHTSEARYGTVFTICIVWYVVVIVRACALWQLARLICVESAHTGSTV